MRAHIDRYVAFFEGLEPKTLSALSDVFVESARFTDPFNDARGYEAIRAVFDDMFDRCDEPRFHVAERICQDDICYLRWTFVFGAAGRQRTVEGVSRVRFAADGRAEEHTDYWDPAKQLYESVPVLGTLLKFLRNKLSATQDRSTTNQSDSSLAAER